MHKIVSSLYFDSYVFTSDQDSNNSYFYKHQRQSSFLHNVLPTIHENSQLELPCNTFFSRPLKRSKTSSSFTTISSNGA